MAPGAMASPACDNVTTNRLLLFVAVFGPWLLFVAVNRLLGVLFVLRIKMKIAVSSRFPVEGVGGTTLLCGPRS